MFAFSVCDSSFAAAVALLAFDALLLVGESSIMYQSTNTSAATNAPTMRFFCFTCTMPP
jgi:hypothetical protein